MLRGVATHGREPNTPLVKCFGVQQGFVAVALRPSAMADYLASYYDVDRQKVGERIVH
jgi:hypothetical protein